MQIDKIKEILEQKFSVIPSLEERRKIIFWYDENGNFKDEISSLKLQNTRILKLEKTDRKGIDVYNNLFNIKYTIEIDDRESNFLIYSPFPKENIFLDILYDIEMYSEEFKADAGQMLIDELNLDRKNSEIVEIIRKHQNFFNNRERKKRFVAMLPENPNGYQVGITLIAALIKCNISSLDEILKELFREKGDEKLKEIEKWIGLDLFKNSIHENFGLEFTSLDNLFKNFAVNHFIYSLKEKNIPEELQAFLEGKINNIYVFVETWLNDRNRYIDFKARSERIENELKIYENLQTCDTEKIVGVKTFRSIDRYIQKKIISLMKNNVSEFDLFKDWISIREDITLWEEDYREFYKVLYRGSNLLKFRKDFLVKGTNTKNIFSEYSEKYWKIDYNYRKFYLAYDNAMIESDIELSWLREQIEIFYSGNFLKNLNSSWEENIQELNPWKNSIISKQRDFYKKYIENSTGRTFVFISDALRYEVAEELKKELLKNLKSSEVNLEAVLSEIPSYTKLGMAALLPQHENLVYINNEMCIGNIPANNRENREKILKSVNEKSCIISYDMIFEREYFREIVKGKDVVYIYHNKIDATGDKKVTENSVFKACEDTIKEICEAVKYLINNIGSLNFYVTSDHGFIYQRDKLEEFDKIEIPKDVLEKNRRFVLSESKEDVLGTITLELGEEYNGIYGVFPKEVYRFKVPGGGANYVHGGISLQEITVPILNFRYSKGNILEKAKVETIFTNLARKITSLATKFSFYQKEGVDPYRGILEKSVTIGLYMDKNLISDEKRINFNSKTPLEYNEILTLKTSNIGNKNFCILRIKDVETDSVLEEIEHRISMGITDDF